MSKFIMVAAKFACSADDLCTSSTVLVDKCMFNQWEILPSFLNIGCIVFGTKIKERTWRENFTSFGRDYT